MTIMMNAQELLRQLWGDDVPATSSGDAASVFGVAGLAEAIGAAVGKDIAEASTTVKMPEMPVVEEAAHGVPIEADTCMRFTGLEALWPGHTFFSWTIENTTYGVENPYTSNVASSSSSFSSVGSGALCALRSVLGWSVFCDSS